MVSAWLCPDCGKIKTVPEDIRTRCFKCHREAADIFSIRPPDGMSGGFRQAPWACTDCGGFGEPPDDLTRCFVCERTTGAMVTDAMRASGGDILIFRRHLTPS